MPKENKPAKGKKKLAPTATRKPVSVKDDLKSKAPPAPRPAQIKSNIPKERIVKLREHLLDRKSGLVEEVAKILQGGKSAAEHRSVEVMDMASDSFDDELAMTLAKNEMEEIIAIDEALIQMNDGTYGLCDSCTSPIEFKRLEALPFATLCVTCKKKVEDEGDNGEDEWAPAFEEEEEGEEKGVGGGGNEGGGESRE